MRCVAIVLDDRVGDRTRSSLRGPDGSPSLPARPSASRRSRGPTNRGSTPSLQLGAGSADILMPGRQRVGGCTEFRRCAATTASNHPQSRLISSPSTDSPSPARCRSVPSVSASGRPPRRRKWCSPTGSASDTKYPGRGRRRGDGGERSGHPTQRTATPALAPDDWYAGPLNPAQAGLPIADAAATDFR